MSETMQIVAEARTDVRKGASRRLRRTGQVPGILYGGGKDPQMFMLPHSELVKYTAQESFYSTLLDLNLAGDTVQVVLKDLQRHPAKPFILHVDFQRVSKGEKLRMTVPIHFENENICKGIKLGGQASHNLTELDILCLPQDLPEFIAVDIADMEIGQTLHVSEISLPKGVELDSSVDIDAPVVVVHTTHTTADDAAGEEEAPEDEAD
ncbi:MULTISPECIES: 50S ribosomal protein L25/general stress protein Ctc [Thiorhodovibrio]|uniref:50S ribosomal protein L25/general stress protein Ctc n=1 Tax=Thiorhodovibrio TaxID=61593 RepID=UPI001911FECD|nr:MULTISPECIES: 50S ribosomal protein L25/general stress protein Ctc [Thiorhodovibrio]MBK5968148.1 50S ribosomal protein L25/general stress protein Ctc [Thiorhodovibrio winogradskyi]WPL13634.1 General stress protein CTC [Thiorhodovibrio litoralis]